MYPATHIVRTCYYECQTQCTKVRVLVSTCYIQTIESSTRGHGRLWPITGSEHFFWPLTFRHTMFSPYISAETSASFFFSFKIYQKTARKQKRCLGANLGHDFPQIIPRDISSAIHHRNTSVRPRRGADMSCWHCACNLVGFFSGTRFLLNINANHNVWVCIAFNGKFTKNPNSVQRRIQN